MDEAIAVLMKTNAYITYTKHEIKRLHMNRVAFAVKLKDVVKSNIRTTYTDHGTQLWPRVHVTRYKRATSEATAFNLSSDAYAR